jgi:hypothetical protein
VEVEVGVVEVAVVVAEVEEVDVVGEGEEGDAVKLSFLTLNIIIIYCTLLLTIIVVKRNKLTQSEYFLFTISSVIFDPRHGQNVTVICIKYVNYSWKKSSSDMVVFPLR